MFRKLSLFVAVFWAIGWVIAGIVYGTMAYRHISYPFYFFLPFGAMSAMGIVPSSLVLLMTTTERWKIRFVWLGIYALAIGAAVTAPQLWRGYYESPRNGGPYLVWSGDPTTSVTVCWSAAAQAPGVVEYTSAAAERWSTADCPSTHYPKVALTALEPGAEYRYRIPALGADTFTFRTAPREPEDFSFAVYGDNRHEGGFSFHRSVVRAIQKEETSHGPFRLLINSGDIVECPGEGYGWQWHTFLRDITPLASSRPYEVSLGNHEARGSTERYEEYFNYGTPDHWRALDYAGVRFIALSTQDPLTADSPQYAWLVNALEERPADNRFTVVTMHKPLLTYDPREDYNDPELRATLEPLFTEMGVDIVFAGHVHAYERHHLAGLEHVISGGGGVLLWNKPAYGPETVLTETCWHFCAVDVRETSLNVRVIRTDGTMIEEFRVLSKQRADSARRLTSLPR